MSYVSEFALFCRFHVLFLFPSNLFGFISSTNDIELFNCAAKTENYSFIGLSLFGLLLSTESFSVVYFVSAVVVVVVDFICSVRRLLFLLFAPKTMNLIFETFFFFVIIETNSKLRNINTLESVYQFKKKEENCHQTLEYRPRNLNT